MLPSTSISEPNSLLPSPLPSFSALSLSSRFFNPLSHLLHLLLPQIRSLTLRFLPRRFRFSLQFRFQFLSLSLLNKPSKLQEEGSIDPLGVFQQIGEFSEFRCPLRKLRPSRRTRSSGRRRLWRTSCRSRRWSRRLGTTTGSRRPPRLTSGRRNPRL